MASHDYVFISHWRVEGSLADAYARVSDPVSYVRWWPHYTEAQEIKAGGSSGVGRVVRLTMRGIPYDLKWQMECTEADPPRRIASKAAGDFEGRGIWTLEQDGPSVNLTLDWRIRAEKPLLKFLSFFLKPLFARNHDRVMAEGEAGLRRELAKKV